MIDDTSAKAAVYLYNQSHIKSSKIVSVDLLKLTDESLLSSRATTTCRHFKIAKQMKRHRDREPSTLSMEKVLRSMTKRKARNKLKVWIRKSIPKPLKLYSFATDYKVCYLRYLNRSNSIFINFVNLNGLAPNKFLKKSKLKLNALLANWQKIKSSSHTRRFSVSRMKLLTLGDVELNPGPQQNVNTQTTLSLGSTTLINFRLWQLGLRPLDVGGAGDCFSRAVSRQLYGDPRHHLHVRQFGINYLRANPGHFIESNTENSWNESLTNMSLQGSWCDALIVQAVA